MAISANETFQQIVKQLYQSESNLHFHVSGILFSAQKLINKRFLKETTGPSPAFPSFKNETKVQDDEVLIHNKYEELERIVDQTRETVEILEKKVPKA